MALIDEEELRLIETWAGVTSAGHHILRGSRADLPNLAESLRAAWEERDVQENTIRQFEHALRVTAELNGDLWAMLVMTLGVSLWCSNEGVEQARVAIRAVQQERDELLDALGTMLHGADHAFWAGRASQLEACKALYARLGGEIDGVGI